MNKQLYIQCLTKQESPIHYRFKGIPILYTTVDGFRDDILSPIITPGYFEKIFHIDFVFMSMLFVSTQTQHNTYYVKQTMLSDSILQLSRHIKIPTLLVPPNLDISLNINTLKITLPNTRKDLCYIIESPDKLGYYYKSSDGISILIHQLYCRQILII